MRLSRALSVLPFAFLAAIVLAGGALAAHAAAPEAVSPRVAMGAAAGAIVLAAVAVIAAGLWRLPPYAGALRLDRHHGLSGRLATALAFSALRVRSTWMEMAIDDA